MLVELTDSPDRSVSNHVFSSFDKNSNELLLVDVPSLFIVLLTKLFMTTVFFYKIMHNKNQIMSILLMKTIIFHHQDMRSKSLVL